MPRRLCHDAFSENMAGETRLLERRRLYHCAAYNCAISVVCCVFTDLRFYQGFLLSEKPEKVGPALLWAWPPAGCALVSPGVERPTTQASLCAFLHLQNLLIFENLIDLKRCYTFPVEVEVSETSQWYF